MKTCLGCNGCLEKMLKSFNYRLNNYKSIPYLMKKHLKNTVISYENKKVIA